MDIPSQPPHSASMIALSSPFLEAIDNRKLKIRLRRDHAPLLTAYGLLHRRMDRAITLALDAVEKYEATRKAEGLIDSLTGQPAFASDAFTDAVYRAAELFEFYDTDIVDYLEPSLTKRTKAEYKKALKNISDHWDRLCNGCKHNHSFLIPVEGKYSDGPWLSGFSSYRHYGEEMRIDRAVHQFSDVLSYNWAFRRLLGAVLEADLAATMLVKALPDDPSVDAINSNVLPLPYSNSFPRIAARALDGFPGEDKLPCPEFALTRETGEEILLASASPIRRAVECKLLYVVELMTPSLSIQQPYSTNVGTFAITRKQGVERRPLGGYHRVIINNIVVQPLDMVP